MNERNQELELLLEKAMINFYKTVSDRLVKDQYLYEYNKEELMNAFLNDYLKEHQEYKDIKQLKDYIYNRIPELLLEDKHKKMTRRRFFCENGSVIRRNELFYLCIILNIDKKKAVEFINGSFKEMYVNFADPYDLLFDYALEKHLSIEEYLVIYELLERMDYEKQKDEIYALDNYTSTTKTHAIYRKYQMFLKKPFDELSFVQFVLDHYKDFHFISHYIYKVFYHLLSYNNNYYHKNYLDPNQKGKALGIIESETLRLRKFDEDLRYYIHNRSDNDYNLNMNISNHIQEYIKKYREYYSRSTFNTHGKSLNSLLELSSHMNRFFIIMTCVLCGLLSEKEINEVLSHISIIRPEFKALDQNHIVDYWIINALSIAQDSNMQTKEVHQYVLECLKYTRLLMLSHDFVKNIKEDNPNLSMYTLYDRIENMLMYFTMHAKLTFMERKHKNDSSIK